MTEVQENGFSGDERNKSENDYSAEEENASASSQEEDTMSDEINNEDIDSIINERSVKGKTKFLVKWKVFKNRQNSWYDEDDLNCPNLITHFRNSRKNHMVNGPGIIDGERIKIDRGVIRGTKRYYIAKTQSGVEITLESEEAKLHHLPIVLEFLEEMFKEGERPENT